MIGPVCLAFCLGMLPFALLPMLPSVGFCIALLILGMLLLKLAWRGASLIAIFMLALSWGGLSIHQTLQAYLRFSEKVVTVDALLIASEGHLRHDIRIIRHQGRSVFPPVGVRLNASRLPEGSLPGQRLRLVLALSPIHSQLNEGGFDSQRFYLAQGILFTAKVKSAQRLSSGGSLLAQWKAGIYRTLSEFSARGIVAALAFGDRTQLTTFQKKLFNHTGTAHLMAISGMHISLAAGVGWLLGRLVQRTLATHRIGFRLPLFLGFGLALAYGWISGYNPPAVRALIALFICGLLIINGRRWLGWEVWLVCITVILFFQPLSLLSDSFVLSVFAVGILLFWHQWVPFPAGLMTWPPILRYPLQLLHLQGGIMLLLLPMQIALFQGISLSAIVANLFAIPLVSFVIVPLILVGLLVNGLPLLSTAIWQGTQWAIDGLVYLLAALPAGWVEVDRYALWLSFSGWIAVVIWRCAAYSYGVLLTAIALSIRGAGLWPSEMPTDTWQVSFLDVGHGLAVAIVRNNRVLLYDTGGAWQTGDAGLKTIMPWLKWHNYILDKIVISHEHRDHIGGLNSLLHNFPQVPVRSSLGMKGHLPCFRGTIWHWQGLHFKVLWPPAKTTLVGNNRSCVVQVSDGKRRLLLTGDLEAQSEIRLLALEPGGLAADFLQVPHHGSLTSSTEPLLKAVRGHAAFASTSRYNPWRFPADKVIRRYIRYNYQWYDTALLGQVNLVIGNDLWHVDGFRSQIVPRWYHQWFGVARDNR